MQRSSQEILAFNTFSMSDHDNIMPEFNYNYDSDDSDATHLEWLT